MTVTQNHTDIVNEGWVSRMPLAIRPYLYLIRADRPIGTWLLLIPALWSILLAGAVTGSLHEWRYIVLFTIGAFVMRGAGCVINDIWDRDLDGAVERTATRPIPNGDITVRQAIIFLGVLLLIGLWILLQFNPLIIALGVVSMVFVVTYPLMKRITWWPQAFLGLTFNFGALMGWSAIMNNLSWQAWMLYIGGIFWTLGYDTIYAFQDRKDDALIGIKSSARWMIEKTKINFKKLIYLFYFIHFLMFFIVLIWNDIYAAMISMIGLMHLVWQVKTLDIDNPQNSLKRFKSNRDYGLIMCIAIAAIIL